MPPCFGPRSHVRIVPSPLVLVVVNQPLTARSISAIVKLLTSDDYRTCRSRCVSSASASATISTTADISPYAGTS